MICPECKSALFGEEVICPYCGCEIRQKKEIEKEKEKEFKKYIPQKAKNSRIKELEEKIRQLKAEKYIPQKAENSRIKALEEKVLQLQEIKYVRYNVNNARIKELEEKIENTGNWAWIFLCLFYPVAIILFILRSQYKRELESIRNNRYDPAQRKLMNLGWKAFGMWWLFAIMGELIAMPIFILVIGKYDDVSMASPVEDAIVFIILMIFIIVLPTLLSIRWYKRKKEKMLLS